MARGGVRITKDTLSPGLDEFSPKVKAAVDQVLDYWVVKASTQMKTNASWTDRTGNARQGLGAQTFSGEGSSTLILYHSVPYGVWLEVRWSGRYAIIGPTLADIAPRVGQMLGQILLRIK